MFKAQSCKTLALTGRKPGRRRLWTRSSLWAVLERGETLEVHSVSNQDLMSGSTSQPTSWAGEWDKGQKLSLLCVRSTSFLSLLMFDRAHWCCPARRLSWGCRSPSPSPPWSPRSPAGSSCPTGWCRWSSPRTPETSACRRSAAPRCSLPWGRENASSVGLLVPSEVCVCVAGL